MSDKVELSVNPIQPTEKSKELTDKVHRLIRRFSRELVELVSQEIGARAIKVKSKPGPKKGYKHRRGICPLCRVVENASRRYGYICRDCRAGKDIKYRTKVKELLPGHKRKKKERVGRDFEVKVKIPEHLPVKPAEVQVEDAEPDFLDRLVEIVKEPEIKNDPPARPDSDAEDFWT